MQNNLRYRERGTVGLSRTRSALGRRHPGSSAGLELPGDLRDWFDEAALLAWLEREIRLLDWQNPRLQEFLAANPSYHPREMLALLALGCLTQVYSSESIVGLCRSENAFKSICGGQPPFAYELSAFRRKNRAVLERVLGGVLTTAVRTRHSASHRLVDVEGEAHHAAVARLDVSRHMDRDG